MGALHLAPLALFPGNPQALHLSSACNNERNRGIVTTTGGLASLLLVASFPSSILVTSSMARSP